MPHRDIFFDVVVNEVAVLACEIVVTFRRSPKAVPEELELQGEIQQVVLQTILTEVSRRFLGIRVDAPLGRVAVPRARQPFADLRKRKSNRSGFVKIVKHLAIQAVAIDGDRGEKTLVQERA